MVQPITTKRSSERGDSAVPRVLTSVALTWGLVYLGWRVTTLGSGWLYALSAPLLLTEIWALVQLALLSVQSWRVPPPARPAPPAAPGTVPRTDVAITAHLANADEVERSLVGTAALVGCGRVTVIDATDRPEIRSTTDRFHATYMVEPAVSTSTASVVHDSTTSGLYVWISGGQVAMPTLLLSLIGRFDDARLATCQTAVGLLNADSLVHLRGGRDEEALLRDVVGPGTDRLGAAPWVGAGSMIRRLAIEETGGFETNDPAATERALIRLHRAGWTSGFDARRLVRATAPDTLDDYLARRNRRAIEELRIFGTTENPLRVKGLGWRHRLIHLATAMAFGTGVRQLLQLTILTAVLLSGQMPFDGPVSSMLAMWLPAALLGVAARHALGRGSMALGDWVRHGWRTVGADVRAMRTVLGFGRHSTDTGAAHDSSGLATLGRLRALTSATILLELAIVARALMLFNNDLLRPFDTGERVVVLAFALVALVPMIDVLQVIVLRRQRRRNHRLSCSLPITLAGADGRTVDLAPTGLGLVLHSAPQIGATTPFALTVPALDGSQQVVEGMAVVRAADLHSDGGVRVGLEFVNLSDTARLALVAYCAIGYSFFGEAVSPPTIAPSHLKVERVGLHQRSLQALTGSALLAAAALFIVGPAAGSAVALDADVIEQRELTEYRIRVVDTTGQPLTGIQARFFIDGWRGATETDTGTFVIETLDAPTHFELLWEGSRAVRPFEQSAVVALAKIRADVGIDVVEIDRGAGWERFEDGMEVLPGRFVVRFSDGSVAKLEIPGGHQLSVPSGVLTQLAGPTPVFEQQPVPTAAAGPTSSPTTPAESPPATASPAAAEDVPVADPTPTTEPTP